MPPKRGRGGSTARGRKRTNATVSDIEEAYRLLELAEKGETLTRNQQAIVEALREEHRKIQERLANQKYTIESEVPGSSEMIARGPHLQEYMTSAEEWFEIPKKRKKLTDADINALDRRVGILKGDPKRALIQDVHYNLEKMHKLVYQFYNFKPSPGNLMWIRRPDGYIQAAFDEHTAFTPSKIDELKGIIGQSLSQIDVLINELLSFRTAYPTASVLSLLKDMVKEFTLGIENEKVTKEFYRANRLTVPGILEAIGPEYVELYEKGELPEAFLGPLAAQNNNPDFIAVTSQQYANMVLLNQLRDPIFHRSLGYWINMLNVMLSFFKENGDGDPDISLAQRLAEIHVPTTKPELPKKGKKGKKRNEDEDGDDDDDDDDDDDTPDNIVPPIAGSRIGSIQPFKRKKHSLFL